MKMSDEGQPQLRARIVETQEELQNLREAWETLSSRCPEANIFSTWEWSTAVWKHAGHGCRMLVIIVEDGPEVIGIAPLVVDGKWPGRAVRFMAAGSLDACYSDYCGFLLAEGREETVLHLILDQLLKHSGEWDVLDLREVPSRSCLMTSWLDMIDGRGFAWRAEPQGLSYPIHLPPTWQSYLARLSPNMRSTLQRKMRKLAREHDLRFERAEDASTLHGGMNLLFDLHTERWRSRGLPGLFDTQKVRSFHMDVAARFLERGWLDLAILFADDVALAAIYNFQYGDTVYFYASGFRPTKEWSQYSLGNILLGRSIERAIRRGVTTFDLLRGDREYKARFAPQEASNYRVQIAHSLAVLKAYSATGKMRRWSRDLGSSIRRTSALQRLSGAQAMETVAQDHFQTRQT